MSDSNVERFTLLPPFFQCISTESSKFFQTTLLLNERLKSGSASSNTTRPVVGSGFWSVVPIPTNCVGLLPCSILYVPRVAPNAPVLNAGTSSRVTSALFFQNKSCAVHLISGLLTGTAISPISTPLFRMLATFFHSFVNPQDEGIFTSRIRSS